MKGAAPMENEVLELITQTLTEDRLNHILDCNEEYKIAKMYETAVYDKLVETLSETQKELFNDFIIATNETEISAERLIYQQGMKDLYAFLNALSKPQE